MKRNNGGNQRFIEICNNSSIYDQEIRRTCQSGKTPLFFACDDQLIGIIAVADVIKEDSLRQ
ncbi:MAG: hypothetical protein ACLVI9_03595 [Anaerostipes hadrus]